MEAPMTMRRPCFIEDDGLASIAVMEPGFSGSNINNNNNNNLYYGHQNQTCYGQNIAPMMRRRNSLRNISSLSSSLVSSSISTTTTSSGSVCSPRSGRFFEARFEEPQSPHFLEACALCKKPLGDNRDIFMYRGDTPFCSEECRQEQMEIDEAKEKNWNLKALRSKKESKKSASSTSSSSPNKNKNYPYRTGTVAAA